MGVGGRRMIRDVAVDGLLAAALGVVVVAGSLGAAGWQVPPRRALDPLAYVLIGVAVAVLPVRRLWPLATLAGTVLAVSAYLALGYPYGPILLTMCVAAYSVAVRLPARRSLIACALAMPVVLTHPFLDAQPAPWQSAVLGLVPASAWLLVPWAVGTVVRSRREAADRVRREAARAQQEDARRRADQERLRVAQEVHDVVGHGLAAIHMQAEIAMHVQDRRPEQARAALAAISRTSKDALDELRAALAAVRHADDPAVPRPPTGLGQLDALVGRMTEAGLAVRLAVTGERRPLPAAVDLAAYRVVQESLTNVLRHAGPATATVHIAHLPGELIVEVTDDGATGDTTPATPDGQGIAGMRARVTAFGGTLTTDTRPQGGFRVQARLPLPEASPSAEAIP
jgi:signal transduction histidine kinase